MLEQFHAFCFLEFDALAACLLKKSELWAALLH